MKRLLACAIFAMLCVFAADYALTHTDWDIMECELWVYDHASGQLEGDGESMMCSLKDLAGNEFSTDYDTNHYELTFFGNLVRVLVAWIGPALMGIVIGVIATPSEI